MKTGKKLLTGTLLAICAALLVLCSVLAIGWSKATKTGDALPEVRNNGTAIQWKYSDEADWHDLVAIADITGPTGQKGADGANGKTPEFRVSENTLQWRYVGDKIWLNLYDLSVLKGLDGKDGADGKDGINGKDGADGKDGTNGQNGSDGADGNTPFIGENGNWWIGETDTGVKAAGTDGTDGVDGTDGEKGDKGDKGAKGDKGDAGQNGSCTEYFHAKASVGTALLQNHSARIGFTEKINRGGLISASPDEITLKKGHTYNIIISGSLGVGSNAPGSTGYYCIQMTDSSEDADFCRDITRIKRDGTKLPYSNNYHSFNFNRMYDASAKDITLKFIFEQSEYNTLLMEFIGTITITALD